MADDVRRRVRARGSGAEDGDRQGDLLGQLWAQVRGGARARDVARLPDHHGRALGILDLVERGAGAGRRVPRPGSRQHVVAGADQRRLVAQRVGSRRTGVQHADRGSGRERMRRQRTDRPAGRAAEPQLRVDGPALVHLEDRTPLAVERGARQVPRAVLQAPARARLQRGAAHRTAGHPHDRQGAQPDGGHVDHREPARFEVGTRAAPAAQVGVDDLADAPWYAPDHPADRSVLDRPDESSPGPRLTRGTPRSPVAPAPRSRQVRAARAPPDPPLPSCDLRHTDRVRIVIIGFECPVVGMQVRPHSGAQRRIGRRKPHSRLIRVCVGARFTNGRSMTYRRFHPPIHPPG